MKKVSTKGLLCMGASLHNTCDILFSSGSKTSKENIDNVASAISQRKVSASDCVQNPPCTTCTILRCKSGSPVSTCATCTFMPERCNLSSIMKTKSPACCPSPLMSSRCPPSILCSSPRCPPRCTVPPRCFRCCEVTGSSPLPTRKVYCDPPICPPSVCSPCSYVKCDPCRPRYEPCCPPLAPCHTPAPAEATPKETTPPPEREMTPEAIRTPEVVKTQSVLVKSQSVLPVSSSHIHRDPCPKSPPPVHRCPSDVEAERPKYFAESITGENTWQMYGVRIHWTDPISPGVSTVKLGTPLTVRLGIEVKPNSCLSADIISAYMWTHMKTQVSSKILSTILCKTVNGGYFRNGWSIRTYKPLLIWLVSNAIDTNKMMHILKVSRSV